MKNNMNTIKVEYNENYQLPEINKKWFKTISQEEYKNKVITSSVSGQPTKIWKDIFKRFFKNKWNILFLSIILVIIFFMIFGDMFTKYVAVKPVKDVDRSLVQFLRPSWNNVPSQYTGKLSDLQTNIDASIHYVPGVGGSIGHLEGANGLINSSTFNETNGMWSIKYTNNNYVGTALGTDSSGISVYSRLIASTRFSIGLGVLVATIETVFGTIIGLYLGYNAGKALDTYFMRFIETFTAIPALLLIIIFVLVLGSSFSVMILSLIIIGWVAPVYIARMFTIKIKDAEFIKASRSLGASDHRIIFSHILPHVLGRVLVSFVNRIPSVIFIESTLVFLGVSVGGDARNSLGNIFQESRTIEAIDANPWFLIAPTLTLLFFTLSLQIISNGIRDAFDAKVSG